MRYLWRPTPGYLSPQSRRERGADIVEAALVLPILFMLLIGLVVFARGWNIYQTMTRAAREGVRQAVTTSCAICGSSYFSNTAIENKVVFRALQAGGVDTSNAVLTSSYTQGYTWLNESANVCGAYISFKYPYTLAIPFIALKVRTFDLRTYVQMRIENPDGTCPP